MNTDLLDESDRQAVLLALAELSLTRPGWYNYLATVAGKLRGREMFENFRKTSADSPRLNIPQARPDGVEQIAVPLTHEDLAFLLWLLGYIKSAMDSMDNKHQEYIGKYHDRLLSTLGHPYEELGKKISS